METKNYQHKSLSEGRWFALSFLEQMANIGSEVERGLNWRNKNLEYSKKSVTRALELLSLTIDDKKNKNRLKELTRLYEVLVDYFFYDNQYGSTEVLWKKYFYPFMYAARKNK